MTVSEPLALGVREQRCPPISLIFKPNPNPSPQDLISFPLPMQLIRSPQAWTNYIKKLKDEWTDLDIFWDSLAYILIIG